MDYLRISAKDNNGIRKVWFNLDARHETFISVEDTDTIGEILERVDLHIKIYRTGDYKVLWKDVFERKDV